MWTFRITSTFKSIPKVYRQFFPIVDFYFKSNYEFKKEKDFLNHYNEFLHILDFEKKTLKKFLCIIGIGNLWQ